jgi:type IV secretory pathway TrbD component
MPVERETIVERPVERQTVVTSGGNPFGVVAGVIAIVLLIALLLWFFGGFGLGGGDGANSVSVDLPNVTVTE